MNILDRYLIREFLVPLFYCLAAFTILFMAYQLVTEIDEIIKEDVPFSIVVWAGLQFIPIVLNYAIPASTLLSTLFCLNQLSKHNELTAMRVSGISLYRIMAPFALMGVVLSIIVFIINDNFSAGSGFEARLIHLIMEKLDERVDEKKLLHVSYFNSKHNRHWSGYYDTESKIIHKPVIREYRRNLIKKLQISAEECKWIDGSWWMFNGHRVSYKLLGGPYPAKSFIKTELSPVMGFNETPADFELSRKAYSKMRFMELQNHRSTIPAGSAQTRKALVELHQKVSLPALSFIVVLIGFPFGVRRTRGGVFLGMGISIVIWIIYYPITIICQDLGRDGSLYPWLAAWLPSILIGAAGLILTYRARY
ncbi:MAG: LptF/LptG family permease [Candidatus Tritonobacter lacicola]|nr:LptF/LptG family permease [Candidatus Tritonobacter lacicola]